MHELTFLHFYIGKCNRSYIMHTCIGLSLVIFLRWKNTVLQMLETCLSNESLLSNSTPMFLTDDEESTEQTSSVLLCSTLLLVGVFGPIINTSVFSECSSKKLFVIQFFYINYAFHKFLNLVCFTGPWRNIELSIISVTVKANSLFPDDISQG